MHEDEKELTRKEKGEIFNYLKEGARKLEIFVSSLNANTRPPEKTVEVALAFAVINGATQKDVTDWTKKIMFMPTHHIREKQQ